MIDSRGKFFQKRAVDREVTDCGPPNPMFQNGDVRKASPSEHSWISVIASLTQTTLSPCHSFAANRETNSGMRNRSIGWDSRGGDRKGNEAGFHGSKREGSGFVRTA